MHRHAAFALSLACIVISAPVARAETPEEWITLGTRIHGFFGSFIPVGIRIGLDARERLKADPRGLSVVYTSGAKAPCPCIADGIMLATQASPGQGTLTIASEAAPDGVLMTAVIRNRKTGEGLRYVIAERWLLQILGWNKRDAAARFDAAMTADGLFQVDPAP